HRDRYSVERTKVVARADLGLGATGLLPREVGRYRHERVEPRLQRCDACEGRLEQRDRRELPLMYRPSGVFDRKPGDVFAHRRMLRRDLLMATRRGWCSLAALLRRSGSPSAKATIAPAMSASRVPLPASGEMPKSCSIQSMSTSRSCANHRSSGAIARQEGTTSTTIVPMLTVIDVTRVPEGMFEARVRAN